MDYITPNESHAPSEIWNNPVMEPFAHLAPGERLHLEHPIGITTIGSDIGCTEFTDQSAPDNLRALRIQFPFLQIIPVPARAVSVALTQNVAAEIFIPDGMVAVIFRGNNDYYVSFNGGASLPVVGGVDTQSVYKPENYLLYVGNKRAVSVIAPNTNTIVTMLCYPLVPMRTV